MLKLISEFLDEPASSEADHRIANHLSLIAAMMRMQKKALREAPSFSREDAEWLLEDCGRRIDTVARVHRLLAAHTEAGARIDVRGYLTDLAEAIVESIATPGEHDLQISCGEGCQVGADDVAPLGLLVGELVTNAVKYAHPAGVNGTISVECVCGPEGSLIVTVTDDGVGLPEGFDPQTSGNIGFRMMRSMIQRLQGDIEFDGSGLGLAVTMRIPARRPLRNVVDFDQAARG